MDLKEVMAQYDGHTERLPQGQIKGGKEIELAELVKELDEWKKVWDRLDPQTADQLSHDERSRLDKELKRHAQVLTNMAFKFDILNGCSKEFAREHLLRENPEQMHLVNDLVSHGAWWLIIGHTKAQDGSDYIDCCHINTRQVVRLKVSADSPLLDNFGLAGPMTPLGEIALY